MNLNANDVKNMSKEELDELNKKLGVEVMKKFLMFHLAKWGIICGSVYIAKRIVKQMEKSAA